MGALVVTAVQAEAWRHELGFSSHVAPTMRAERTPHAMTTRRIPGGSSPGRPSRNDLEQDTLHAGFSFLRRSFNWQRGDDFPTLSDVPLGNLDGVLARQPREALNP